MDLASFVRFVAHTGSISDSPARPNSKTGNAFQPHLANGALLDERRFRAAHRPGILVGKAHKIGRRQVQLLQERLVVSEESLISLGLGFLFHISEGPVNNLLMLGQFRDNVDWVSVERQGLVDPWEERLLCGKDNDSASIFTCTGSTTDSVHVLFSTGWKANLNDKADIREVHTATNDIGSHQDTAGSILELLCGFGARRL